MDPTQQRLLGKTDISLTQLGLGGVALGELFTRVSDDEAHDTLSSAWKAGLRYFDTAPLYGMGLSEHRFGAFLRTQARNEFVLSTKVGRTLCRPRSVSNRRPSIFMGGLQFEFEFDYGYDGIMRSFEDSLQRLGLTSVDLLAIHDLDRWHHETDVRVSAHLSRLVTSGWRALEELRSSGAIRGIGVGVNELETIALLTNAVDVDFVLLAMRYTLLDQTALDGPLDLLTSRGIGVIAGSVFNSGILATGAVAGAKYNYADAPPDILDRTRRIESICSRHGVSLPAVALQFPLGHPTVASVIPGAFHADQVQTIVRWFEERVPSELWEELKAEGCLHLKAPTLSE
jgi:D-threo-aldose 1-dehydrogenase